MLRFLKLAAALAVVPMIAFVTPALAVGEGQIESGDIYRIKNITKNIDFVDPANADACNLLEYKVRIHDPGPGFLTNVNVWVDLPSEADTSNISTIVVSAQNANPSATFDTATLNLSSAQSVSYVNGTTQLLDASGNVIQNLPDGITQGGIGIGNVGVSFSNREYVQFQARVSCPSVPVTFSSTQTVSATASATGSATVNCPKGSVASVTTANATASATVSATASATSTVSQADADQKARAAAQSQANSSAQSQAQAAANANAQTAATAKCKPAVVTPSAPVTTSGKGLPNTGPGSIAAIFAGVSTIAGAGHYFIRGRRG